MTSEHPSNRDLAASAEGDSVDSDAQSSSGISSKTKTMRSSRKTQKAADAFRTISEVAKALDVQQHVLRFWETKFSYVRPLKRGGGRRYYRPEDFALLKSIHYMLYTEGYTIKGVQKILREKGKNSLIDMANGETDDASSHSVPTVPEPLLAQRPQAYLETKAAAQNEATPFSSTPVLKRSDLGTNQKDALRAVLNELKEIRSMIKQPDTQS